MILAPDLVYIDGAFVDGVVIEIDEATGRIRRAGAGSIGEVVRLPRRAIVPGFVNAHSHSFQRAIRGRTQWKPVSERAADFWSWREQMYAAALTFSPDQVETVARACFIEMLKAGYTTVGEFHYLQRDRDGKAYNDPNELAKRVITAATDVGIRIVLLNVCYATGSINEPLRREQARFATPDLDAFLADTVALRDGLRSETATVGIAPHSVRAVPREWLAPLAAAAASMNMPLHMHVNEQPAEVVACEAAYGMRPIELLHAEGVLSHRFTGVHGTHADAHEIALLGAVRAHVCACPTTERDLGDGLLPAAEVLNAGAGICIGTDSQTVIDPWEEVRLIEYHERLRSLKRVVLTKQIGNRLETAPVLIDAGTRAGAASLRIDAGRIAENCAADLVGVDLSHPSLAGWTRTSLAAMLAHSAPANVVADVWVGGRQVVREGRHPQEVAVFRRYENVVRQVMP